VVNALATIMAVNAGEKELELAIGVESDVPRTLIGDALRLQQVLVNLVGNAIKFTERGEVSLLVELLQSIGDTVLLRFRIRDTGIGMNIEQKARLFTAFTQADASTTRRFGGTGLGLAICKSIIDLMGGNIEVPSKFRPPTSGSYAARIS
jgi:signal transduction histidine kinase